MDTLPDPLPNAADGELSACADAGLADDVKSHADGPDEEWWLLDHPYYFLLQILTTNAITHDRGLFITHCTRSL